MHCDRKQSRKQWSSCWVSLDAGAEAAHPKDPKFPPKCHMGHKSWTLPPSPKELWALAVSSSSVLWAETTLAGLSHRRLSCLRAGGSAGFEAFAVMAVPMNALH